MNDAAPNPFPEEVKALHAALAEAQGEFPPITRDKTVTVETKTGGRYSFAYAPLDVILAAVRPVLSKHGLALIQRLEAPGGVPSIRTEVLHRDGARIAATFPLGDSPGSPQALGSLLTYHRRYAVVALLGLAAEDDDDAGQAGEARAAAPAASAEPPTFQVPKLRPDEGAAEDLSDAQRRKIYAIRTKLVNAGALTEDQWGAILSADYGTESVRELTKGQASALIERLVRAEQEIAP